MSRGTASLAFLMQVHDAQFRDLNGAVVKSGLYFHRESIVDLVGFHKLEQATEILKLVRILSRVAAAWLMNLGR